ncbi:MAG: DUF389 domain-containing protein [Candidatus Enteromonas sp.]
MSTREDEPNIEKGEGQNEPLPEAESPVLAPQEASDEGEPSIDPDTGENNDADVIFDITPKDKKVRHRSFRKRLHSFFSIRDDVASHDKIRERIVNGGKITGTNASILIFAILIACCGLYTNSIPVVIGAMLISPLMGTLLAISYGITSADARFTRDAIVGFTFQFIIAFVIAVLFFLILPKCPDPAEFTKRCHPTIFDIIIALCGGAAGMIAQTRSSKYSNVIPGVAIATALMPPLCTMGYSLAKGEWQMLAGSSVLFIINVYCIVAAGVVVLGLLQVPKVSRTGDRQWKILRFVMIRNEILVALPAIVLVILVSLGIFNQL